MTSKLYEYVETEEIKVGQLVKTKDWYFIKEAGQNIGLVVGMEIKTKKYIQVLSSDLEEKEMLYVDVIFLGEDKSFPIPAYMLKIVSDV